MEPEAGAPKGTDAADAERRAASATEASVANSPRKPLERARTWSSTRLSSISATDWIATAVFGIALFYAIRAAGFFTNMHAALHFDEGYATAFGERLLDGHLLPYVDA